VPFVRFARDKRGYEYVYLVHESTRGGRASRPIVLYWYRTPPGVKVGRPPFDEEVRQRLEAQNPEIRFDWRAITSAQPPPPDAEHWRERRRAEKAAKLARIKDELVEPDAGIDSEEDAMPGAPASVEAVDARADEFAVAPVPEPASVQENRAPAAPDSVLESASGPASGSPAARSRRRRRGRRRRERPGGVESRSSVAASAPEGAAAGTVVPGQEQPEEGQDLVPEEPEDS